jgi:hypothetical protein
MTTHPTIFEVVVVILCALTIIASIPTAPRPNRIAYLRDLLVAILLTIIVLFVCGFAR